ncbi:MAG: DUF2905 domain-containing protein [Ignavibacteriales bacterium]|nr:DUF2905 domain-containing protein [Ignavibacteriales bacterium]
MTQHLGKILIILGIVITGIGILLRFTDKIPFIGKLPGDISINKENYQIFFPITTSIILSILLTGIIWLLSYLSKK